MRFSNVPGGHEPFFPIVGNICFSECENRYLDHRKCPSPPQRKLPQLAAHQTHATVERHRICSERGHLRRLIPTQKLFFELKSAYPMSNPMV